MSPGQKAHVPLALPRDRSEIELTLGRKKLRLTNLEKLFWPDLRLTKRDLLQYYLDVSAWLLPHITNRAMVMKRYPNGAAREFFFMKRTPWPRPDWIRVCSIEHASGNIIDFPVIEDLAGLLWLVNLGCIDPNPWYARCDDIHRPDYLHFDLDPVERPNFERLCEAALAVRDFLTGIRIPGYAKTSGSRGMHIYVPIRRGRLKKQVWSFAKQIA